MKKLITVTLLPVAILIFCTGCNIPFFNNADKEDSAVVTYNIFGTVLDKTENEAIVVGTAALTGQVSVNNVLWQQLQPGDQVEVLLSKDGIISVNLPGDKLVNVYYVGPSYETTGVITNKHHSERGFALEVGFDRVAGLIYLEEDNWENFGVGDEVKVFYNLKGIQLAELNE